MSDDFNLSYEQQAEICDLIDKWYLEWKKKIVDVKKGEVYNGHYLGVAKEELKSLICYVGKDEETIKALKMAHEDFRKLLSK